MYKASLCLELCPMHRCTGIPSSWCPPCLHPAGLERPGEEGSKEHWSCSPLACWEGQETLWTVTEGKGAPGSWPAEARATAPCPAGPGTASITKAHHIPLTVTLQTLCQVCVCEAGLGEMR